MCLFVFWVLILESHYREFKISVTRQRVGSSVLMFVMANFKKVENVKNNQFIPHRNQLCWCYVRSRFLSLLFSTPYIHSNLFPKMERGLKKGVRRSA